MYDPSDERVEDLFSTLLHQLRSVPDRLAKNALAAMFEETALLSVMLEERGIEAPSGMEREEALGRLWDKVEAERNARAEALTHSINRHEF